MREIKFRAFDKEAGEMIYSDQQYDNYFFEFKDGKLCAFAIREDEGTIHEPPQAVVEELDSPDEYIGLKDKNGKEIYESDIIEMEVNIVDGYDPALAGEITHNENLHYKIVMGDIPQWLKLVPITDKDNPYSCEDYSWWLDENPEIEIIGNKYENPELKDES